MSIVALSRMPNTQGDGIYAFGNDGGVFGTGNAPLRGAGSLPGLHVTPSAPIVGGSVWRDGSGYLMVGSDGAVYGFGGVTNYNTGGHVPVSSPAVGIWCNPVQPGYMVMDSTGHLFGYGISLSFTQVNPPAVAGYNLFVWAANGNGFWVGNNNGTIYGENVAGFSASPTGGYVSTGESTPTSGGLYTCDFIGGAMVFGDAIFTAGETLPPATTPTGGGFMIGCCGSQDGGGYIMVDQGGDIYQWGDSAPGNFSKL